MEQVSKRMMEELNNVNSLDEILDGMYDDKKCKCIDFDYWYLKSYLKYNDFSDEAYLKIIKHINGDPQFESEKPKKYVVRTKKANQEGDYWWLVSDTGVYTFDFPYDWDDVVKFDTKEEAEEWTNPQTEVVEVEE